MRQQASRRSVSSVPLAMSLRRIRVGEAKPLHHHVPVRASWLNINDRHIVVRVAGHERDIGIGGRKRQVRGPVARFDDSHDPRWPRVDYVDLPPFKTGDVEQVPSAGGGGTACGLPHYRPRGWHWECQTAPRFD